MKKLINKALAQDRAAQKQLYLAYCDYLMAVIYRYMGNMHDAQEVLQITFIKIFSHLSKFDGEKAAFKTWAHRIAINESIRFLQKQKKLKYTDLDQASHLAIEIEHDLEAEALYRLIQNLPATHRTILTLYHFDEYSHAEISTLLGISESSSRSQLSRARKLLKSQYHQLNATYYEQ